MLKMRENVLHPIERRKKTQETFLNDNKKLQFIEGKKKINIKIYIYNICIIHNESKMRKEKKNVKRS